MNQGHFYPVIELFPNFNLSYESEMFITDD